MILPAGCICTRASGINCFIGGQSLILPGITIGDGSIVGAGSVVTKDVPARTAVAGKSGKGYQHRYRNAQIR